MTNDLSVDYELLYKYRAELIEHIYTDGHISEDTGEGIICFFDYLLDRAEERREFRSPYWKEHNVMALALLDTDIGISKRVMDGLHRVMTGNRRWHTVSIPVAKKLAIGYVEHEYYMENSFSGEILESIILEAVEGEEIGWYLTDDGYHFYMQVH